MVAAQPATGASAEAIADGLVATVRALRENDTIGFKGRLRSADLLLIDDVQFFANKDRTQIQFSALSEAPATLTADEARRFE